MMTTSTPMRPPASSLAEVPSSIIKPILRKPSTTLAVSGQRRKRDDDDDGEDLRSGDPEQLMAQSPKKRKTVMFNEGLNMVKDISSKTLEDAKREVKQALEGHGRGDDEDYDILKEHFSPAPTARKYLSDEGLLVSRSQHNGSEAGDEEQKPQDLLVYVVALTVHAPLMTKACSGLLKSVLRCAWLDRDDTFTRAYIQLLAALSSVQASFFSQILSMLVDKFLESGDVAGGRRGKHGRRGSDAAVPEKTVVPGFPPVDKETRKERLHLGLRYLLDVFPAGRTLIIPLVTDKFPYSEQPKSMHLEYIDHLLRLKVDRPELERDIMELIIGRLVKIDVEMTLDMENVEDETTKAVLRQLKIERGEGGDFNDVDDEDDEEDDSDDDESVDDNEPEEDSDEKTQRILTLKSKIETMDAILALLFEIYTPAFKDPDSKEAEDTFLDLLSDFSNVILPHLRSRNTQYLLFKFAVQSNHLMDLFIGTLFSIAFESNRPPVVRQAAVAYLASFTARGARVDSDKVQTIARTLLNYIDAFRRSHLNCKGPDVRRYSEYYSYFQGLLYIFCFRWRDLMDRDLVPSGVDWEDPTSFLGRDLPWMPGLRTGLQANIASKLNVSLIPALR